MFLHELLKEMSGDPKLIQPSEKLTTQDILLYIYTSGTTGLPKWVIYSAIFRLFLDKA
jgi:acyl-coenzyme A synthetase/AMP-(fatty) acid ligase